VDIALEFDNPHGVFLPGCEVTGSISFTVRDSPLKARAVLISVSGQARTNWTVSERHTTNTYTSNGTQTQATHRTVTYAATCPYAEGEAVVWSPAVGESSGHIPVGTHKFPFKFLLPSNCPPSFEGTHGYVRYYCKAKIDRPWKFDHTAKRLFTVVPTFDLNLVPSAAHPASTNHAKELGFLFFKSGTINLTARLCKGGFVPGESIQVQVDVENNTSKSITKIELKLVEMSRYVAYRYGQTVNPIAPTSRSSEQRVHKRTVNQFEEKVETEKGAGLQYSRLIPIPPVVPTFNECPIITVEYFVKVKVSTSGAIGSSVATQVPVLIGTIPVRIPWQTAPYPELPQGMPAPVMPANDFPDAPPSYEECVFGAGTIKDEEDNKDFAPRYVFYPNISPSAPPLENQ
ncbi:hypothetical protein PFISCL1PPCAC_8954, partial [Pristionchus fissidentatus]